jgi:chemotaxis protein methyltransferase CheR
MAASETALPQDLSTAISKDVLSEREFAALASLIQSIAGIRMPPAKKLLLEARLRRRMNALGMASYSAYCDYILGPGRQSDEIIRFIDVVTTNKTDFFREPEHFEVLVQQALPTLMEKHGAGVERPLTVWSAGCSSGQEPYTLAMVLSEFAESRPDFRTMILATDICTDMLEAAKRAIYTEEQIAPVPMRLRRKYLLSSKERSRELVRIAPPVRQMVRFRRLNFIDGDFGMREPMDVIFCRNVFIYFQRDTQEAILNRFVRHLTPGGFIFLGHTESINGLNAPLVQVAPAVFRGLSAR